MLKCINSIHTIKNLHLCLNITIKLKYINIIYKLHTQSNKRALPCEPDFSWACKNVSTNDIFHFRQL